MNDATKTPKTFTGGCQCGAVRFEWVEPPRYASVCFCRMCQKASGQPFMALTGGPLENLRWTRGAPTVFKSSDKAERGFCSACGTQLTYQFEGNGRISVASNSFDDPEAMPPSKVYGIEGKVSWFDTIGSLPAKRTEDWIAAAGLQPLVSRQHPDHDRGE